MSYPCFTEKTEGLTLNNSSGGGGRTCPNFQLWFFPAPTPSCAQSPLEGLLSSYCRGNICKEKKSHCLIQLTHQCSTSRTWKASQVERAQRTQTRCLCTCNYLNSRLYARPGDFTGATLFKNQCTVPSEASPKRTGKGTNMSLQEN